MIAKDTGRGPLAPSLLWASQRQCRGCLAQLGIKLSLLWALLAGATRWLRAKASIAQLGPLARQGWRGAWRQLGFEWYFERVLLTGFVRRRGRWCQTCKETGRQEDINLQCGSFFSRTAVYAVLHRVHLFSQWEPLIKIFLFILP